MENKIGVGLITCDRIDFFKKSAKSIIKALEKHKDFEFVVINDGKTKLEIPKINCINTTGKIGVGKAKNIAFKELLAKGCDHIFIVEDDIVIKNSNVFEAYINARNITGIQHFMFGYHGPANKNNISGGPPAPRYIVNYDDGLIIAINQHSVGAFCYYTKEVLNEIGLIDETFENAFDHVDHDYRIAKAGYCTPYWNWPDLANSMDYLEEIECSERNSTIRTRENWKENIEKGAQHFKKKHGVLPAWKGCVPDTSKNKVIEILKKIKNENKLISTK
jgi:GT2 family glycosyltransferase